MKKYNKQILTFNKSVYEPAIIKWSLTTNKKIDHKIMTSQDCERILRNYYCESNIELNEKFVVLFLNRGNKLIGVDQFTTGHKSGIAVDVGLLIGKACVVNASALIISHNHPSGNLTISSSDKEITKKIKEALKLVDMTLMDHVVLTKESHYSFADEGIL